MTKSTANWKSADAVVYSVERRDATKLNFAHYLISYHYEVGSDRFNGEFRNYVTEDIDFVHAGDRVRVKYDPANPRKSCCPTAVSARPLWLMAGGVVLALLLIVVFVVAMLKPFH